MKTLPRSFWGLALAIVATFTGCDSGSSTSSSNGGSSSGVNSPVGTWSRTESGTSSTTVLTFGTDKSYREDVTMSSMGVSSVTRYSGTWSTTGENMTVTITKTEVNANGSGWTAILVSMPVRSGKFAIATGVLSYAGTGVAMRYVSGTSGQVPAETIPPPATNPGGGTTNPVDSAKSGNAPALVGIWVGTQDGLSTTYSFGANGSLSKTSDKSYQSNLVVYDRVTGTWTTSASNLIVKWIKEEKSTNLDAQWNVVSGFTPDTTTSIFSVTGTKLTIIYEGGAVLLTKVDQPIVATKVSAPLLSPNGGSFTASQTVTLVSTTTGASIYYTADGTTPTENSRLSTTGVIQISSSMTIKAIAIKDGVSSAVSSATFVIEAGGSTGGNTGSVPGALVGSWIMMVEGYSQTDTYNADGTYMTVAYDAEATEAKYLRLTGTFTATGSKLVQSLRNFDYSYDGKIWTLLGGVFNEHTGSWSVSGSTLTVVSEDGDTTIMTKVK